MTDMDRARELIEKYLDEVIDKAELAELELLIVSDPEVAREFARCARTDGFVYFHYNHVRAEQALDLAKKPDRAFVEEYKPSRARRPWGILERLVGPTGSVLIHVAIIATLIFLVSYEPPPKTEEWTVIKMVDPNDTPPLDLPPELPLDTAFTPGAEPGPAPADTSAVEEPAPVESYGPEEEVDLTGIEIDSDVKGALILPDGMGSRSSEGRGKARDEFGGNQATEAAVLRALGWLREHQQPDGSWGPNKVPLTGLSLLTFLAHGEVTSSKDYGKAVEGAVRFLLSKQRDDGTFVDVNTQAGPYEHGIATYAMCEAYGLTRIPALKPAMEKAVQVILNGQQKGGGWDYRYGKAGRRDTSVAGWQIQALKAAMIAGAENEGIREALEKAAVDLKKARDPATGKFHYTDSSSKTSDSITGVAVLCLELIGEGDSKEARQGLSALTKSLCKWEAAPEWAMYGWYYITQAKFHEGGSEWKGWNSQFARAFTKSQNKDGSWTAPKEDERKYGPAYSTTLAALTLQVYYRFLPTYKTVEINKTLAAAIGGEEVTVVVQ